MQKIVKGTHDLSSDVVRRDIVDELHAPKLLPTLDLLAYGAKAEPDTIRCQVHL